MPEQKPDSGEQRDRMTWRERRKARREAVGLYVECDGDWAKAEPLLEQRMRDAGFSILVWIAIASFIFELFKWWSSRGVTNPGDQPLFGEPGGDA